MKVRLALPAALLTTSWLLACGGPPPPPPHDLASLRALLARPKDPKAEGLREARALREAAERAYGAGDLTMADALGSEGGAKLLRAEALTRKEAAEKRLANNLEAKREEEHQALLLEDRIRDAELEGAELDRRISSLRDALAEQKEGPASPERIAARRASARAIIGEARLLCGAALLRGGNARGVDLDSLETTVGKSPPKSAKDASRSSLELVHAALEARLECLRHLTATRRAPISEAPTPQREPIARLKARGWTERRDDRGTTLVPPAIFRFELPGDELEAFSSVKRLQIVHRATDPKAHVDASALRAATKLPESAMRIETLATTDGRDAWEFTLVE